ncbi:MAG: hypothetical protein ACI9LU_002655, partial [Polaribacter sp.]
MKFISYCHNDIASWGALKDNDQIVPLGSDSATPIAADLKSAIAQDKLELAISTAHSST